MQTDLSPKQNHLLAALSAADFDRVLPDLKPVPMPLGKVIYESGAALKQVYFPTDCIVSMLYVMKDGASAEIAVWAMKAWSASPYSWGEKQPPAARWCKARGSRSSLKARR